MSDYLVHDFGQVIADPTIAWRLSPNRAAALLAAVAGAQAVLAVRMQPDGASREVTPPDRGLNAEQAAAVLGGHVTAAYLRRYFKRYSFARLIGRDVIFSEQGIQRFLAAGLTSVGPSSPRPISGRQRRVSP